MLFDKISPEAAGISSRTVKRYIELLERRSIPMHSVLMMIQFSTQEADCLFMDFNHDWYLCSDERPIVARDCVYGSSSFIPGRNASS